MTELSNDFKKNHIDKVFMLVGLVEQLNTIVHVFYQEKIKIEKQKKEADSNTLTKTKGHSISVTIPWINTTHETALKASIIFFQFSVIEAIVNMLSDLTIQINESKYFEPNTKLSQSEIDFLLEQTTSFDSNKKEIKSRTSFKRLEDKIENIPYLFAKMMGKEFILNKGDGYWEKFKSTKTKRDSLTHPKTKRIFLTDQDIFNTSGVIYWLAESYFFLIRDCVYPGDDEPYNYIENTTGRLIALTHHATLKKYSIKPYIEKQKSFKMKNK